MKPSSKPSPLIRHSEAAELLTSRAVLLACEEAGWLKPCVKRKKMTVYNRADILAAAQRILSGEYPRDYAQSESLTARLTGVRSNHE
jgi:hypothetical protein